MSLSLVVVEVVVVEMKEGVELLRKRDLQDAGRALVDCSLNISLLEALGRCADRPLNVVFAVVV